jgi:phospholipid/cholesterol/gamma-HCH transport system substrate-binding protein
MSRIGTIRHRALGVAFVGLIAGLLILSILVYAKFFTKTVNVTLFAGCQVPPASAGTGPTAQTTAETASDTVGTASSSEEAGLAAEPICTSETSTQDDSAGHQLDVPADVKLRGILVGQVTNVELAPDDRRAVLTLKLDPDQVHNIPSNVSAEIIPKTLFGEKYVDLVIPSNPSNIHIAAGDRIVQSSTSIEAEQVFNDLLPLLNTLQPAELSMTLGNLAEALEGRGNLLGDNLERTDEYLNGLNPDLGNIETDITGVEDLANNVNDATPDLLAQARQFSVSARTIGEKGDTFANFLTGTEGFANTATAILTRNQTNLVQLAQISQPTLALLAEFSPEYTCTLQGLTDQANFFKQAISPHGDNQYALHINLTIPSDSMTRHSYTTADTPKNEAQNVAVVYPEADRKLDGPCFGLPAHRTSPISGEVPINGTPIPENSPMTDTGSATAAPSSFDTAAESSSPEALARMLEAPMLGVSGEDVPDLATLLLAPALAGSAVSVTTGGGSS